MGILAVLAIAIIIASQPAGPTMEELNTVAEKHIRILVFDENGNELNANVWRKGTYWCAEMEGYLSDCAKEKNGAVRITILKDPAEKKVTVNVSGCAFLAYGPKGAPLTGPIPCGELTIKPGRYEFALFDENGVLLKKEEVFFKADAKIAAEGNTSTKPAVVQVFDEMTGKELNAWVSYGGIALQGHTSPVSIDKCNVAHAWATEHKIMDAYICPGDEENVTLPKQVNGGTMIISAPGADKIIVADKNGNVYTVITGEEVQLRDVPPGAYVIYAINGSAVGKKLVDVREGQQIITIGDIRGRATIETEKTVQVFAMGEKIAEGTGQIDVPARTVLHVIVIDKTPREEKMVLLPGEVKII